jgi:hypothetical protein
MHPHAAEFRRCLDDCDVVALRQLWAHCFPHLPQPRTDVGALIILHRARTEANSSSLKKWAYSHRWLEDNGHQSGLPDHLKPAAERIYPKIVDAVGISVRSLSRRHREEARALQSVMSDAVADAYADGRKDPVFVKARMMEAREKILKTA